MRLILILASLLFAAPAYAQLDNPPNINDAVAGMLSSAVPPNETVGGAAGVANTIRRSDAIQPRITRAANCTLDATGSCSITWATALSAGPTIVTTPINPPAAQAVMCNTTATPTTTAVSIRCWTIQTTILSLAIVTTGLTLAPAALAPAGTVVQVIALPPTQ